jgi:hypothetical protein
MWSTVRFHFVHLPGYCMLRHTLWRIYTCRLEGVSGWGPTCQGGLLLDSRGRLVGVNTAATRRLMTVAGFAIGHCQVWLLRDGGWCFCI